VLSLLWFFFEIHVNVQLPVFGFNQCLVIFQSVLSIYQIGFPFYLEYKLVLSYSFVVRFFLESCWLIKSSFWSIDSLFSGFFNFGAGLNPTRAHLLICSLHLSIFCFHRLHNQHHYIETLGLLYFFVLSLKFWKLLNPTIDLPNKASISFILALSKSLIYPCLFFFVALILR
jgi:hypothetical protein